MIKAFRLVGQLKDFVSIPTPRCGRRFSTLKAANNPPAEPQDLKSPEWDVFSNPESAQESRDFRLRSVESPDGYKSVFQKVVLVEKLREVRE